MQVPTTLQRLMTTTSAAVVLAASLAAAGAAPAQAAPARVPAAEPGGVAVDSYPSDAAALAKEAAAKETEAPSLASSAAAAPPASKTLAILVQAQERDYWCAPAAGRAALSALRANPPSQATLAAAMNTTAAQLTLPRNIPPALNSYQSRNAYVRSTGMSLADYRTYVRNGLVNYSAPSIPSVQMANLPWYRGSGISGGHAVTIYGYATATKQWNVSVYDPFDGIRHTGVASGTMYDAGFNNHELVW
ncbi:MAG TPA: C39 family peptidase [Catenuloplanes sp.]